MNRRILTLIIVPMALVLFAAGCATTRARKQDPAQDPQRQVTELQNQLVAKDQQIADLEYQLDSNSQGFPTTNFTAANSDKRHLLRVAGVSVSDVQSALTRAGLDPGPVDGKLGKKTRSAIKAFQRKNGLTADGVVGKKTWAAL